MRICSGAGCLRTVPDAVRLCEECRADKSVAHTPTGWERAATDPMLLEYKGRRWLRGIRPRALHLYPFCVDCKLALSAVADHEIPARLLVAVCRAEGLFPAQRYPGFYIVENIKGRCHSCHNRKTRIEDTQDWTAAIDVLLAPFRADRERNDKDCGVGG
jgi:hypothetical protein